MVAKFSEDKVRPQEFHGVTVGRFWCDVVNLDCLSGHGGALSSHTQTPFLDGDELFWISLYITFLSTFYLS